MPAHIKAQITVCLLDLAPTGPAQPLPTAPRPATTYRP